MAELIRMLKMTDSMEEGNILEWSKKEGDTLNPGEVLFVVQTDKADMEIENLWKGTLLKILVPSGVAKVGDPIAVIGKPSEDFSALLASTQAGGGTAAPAPAAAAPAATPPLTSHLSPLAADDQRLKASPLAKSMAKESGVNIAQIAGSGESGRIVKRDVEAFLESKPAAQPAESQRGAVAPAVAAGVESFEEIPVNQMRKVIARRLAESKFSAPHFYLTIELDMDKAVAARPGLNEISPVKISYNDFVVKACAAALKQHPAVNSSWLGDKIRRHHHVHIGVAVAVEDGLLVPVIRHADQKSLSQIGSEVRLLAEKAKNRKLQPDEMSGNTFTISNLGMFDIEEFTAIINPPDACILAVGSILEKPVVKNGSLAIGHRMKVTLSCDHRVVDGATGAKFLQTLKQLLEDPIRLLI